MRFMQILDIHDLTNILQCKLTHEEIILNMIVILFQVLIHNKGHYMHNITPIHT